MTMQELERFPCGCHGRFVFEGSRKIQEIYVSPDCKFDREKIGCDIGHVRYLKEKEGNKQWQQEA